MQRVKGVNYVILSAKEGKFKNDAYARDQSTQLNQQLPLSYICYN